MSTQKVDINKSYRTRSGLRVIGLERKEFNSAGKLVTYPIKGSVVVKEKPLRLDYCIWTDEGLYQAVKAWGPSSYDLVEDDGATNSAIAQKE